jgi:polyketide biosynthesis enoyl-CoA hydratase PksI
MSDAPINLNIDERGIAIIRMQDQARKNALSREMVIALRQACVRMTDNENIKVVIIAGLHEYFSTGASEEILLEIAEKKIPPEDLVLPQWLLDIPAPTIAAMEGHAVGGGLALGLCADIILMAEESRYGCTFMKMGFTPGMGTTRFLEHAVSPAIAAEMLFTGKTFRGSELQGKCGVNYILPRAAVLPKALDLAADIAEKPRRSLTLLKQTLSRSRKKIYDSALEDESRMHRESFAQTGIHERIKNNFG